MDATVGDSVVAQARTGSVPTRFEGRFVGCTREGSGGGSLQKYVDGGSSFVEEQAM
jgi:hypothetical protein